MNEYLEIKRAFDFLECLVRNHESIGRCRVPANLHGRPAKSALRDYSFCLMLVSMIAKFEDDIDSLTDIPHLKASDKLSPRLKILRDHFSITTDLYDTVDRIREARNSFVHEGQMQVDTGCTKVEIAGRIVDFLRKCK